MKKNNILIAVFAMMTVASVVNAEEINFDGKNINGVSFANLLKTEGACQNDKLSCEQPKPTPVSGIEEKVVGSMDEEAVGPNEGFHVLVNINNSDNITVEQNLKCMSFDGQLNCQDIVTKRLVKEGEIPALLVGKDTYSGMKRNIPVFPSKHSYNTCSSGHSFQCVDWCRTWVVVSTGGSWTVGPNGLTWTGTEERQCSDWSHDCSDNGLSSSCPKAANLQADRFANMSGK